MSREWDWMDDFNEEKLKAATNARFSRWQGCINM